MYHDPKKSTATWGTQIFLGLSVVVLIIVVAFGIFISRDGGVAFRDLIDGDSGNAFSIKK